MNLLRRNIPVAIAFLCGVIFAIQYYVPAHISEVALEKATTWDRILLGFAFMLGLYSLVHMHWQRIRRRQPGFGYSLLVYVGLVAALFFGLVGEVQKLVNLAFGTNFEFAEFQGYVTKGGLRTWGNGLTWIFNSVYQACASTMFSILAFFIASAAYRTFRARTWEATLLLLAAVIVMFGRVPLGGLVSEYFPDLAEWIMGIPNMAAKRGILLGVCLGSIATSLRIIFGIERAYLGGD